MEKHYPARKQQRLSQYDYTQPGYYFVTICTKVRFEDIFCRITPAVGGGLCAAPSPQAPHVVLTDLGHSVKDAIEQIPAVNQGVNVDNYTIMPDHIHMILNLTGRHGGRPLPDIIRRFKSYVDHCYRVTGASIGPYLWQRGYHDHIIRNDADLHATRQYIQNNPIQWVLDRT